MNHANEFHRAMIQRDEEEGAPLQPLATLAARDRVNLRDVDVYYPAEFDNNRDAEKEAKMVLRHSMPGDMGMKVLKDEDVNFLYNKAKQQELINFDAWYASVFDHRDPAQLELSRRVNPGWFQRRMTAVEKSLNFQKKIAKLNLFGIQNEDDVLTSYAIASGRIEPDLYAMNFMQPAAPAAGVVNRQYRKGMFAPRVFDDFTRPVLGIASATEPLTAGEYSAGGQMAVTKDSFLNAIRGNARITTPAMGGFGTRNLTDFAPNAPGAHPTRRGAAQPAAAEGGLPTPNDAVRGRGGIFREGRWPA